MFAKNAMNDQHSKRVSEVSQRPENKYCADCGYPDPDWASYTIGVFLCNNCASVHRSIGVHISRTKSVKLDKWEKTYVSRMEEVGNERAKELYEKFVPIYYPRPKYGGPNMFLDQWIRAKYERKEFTQFPLNTNYNQGDITIVLMKRGKKGDKFAPRTFILSHNIGELSYFIKADDKKPKATIKVANLNVSYSEKTHKNGLQLTYLKGGATRSIFVYHEEENTKAAVDWFLAIRATKLKHLQIAYPTKRPEELADYLTIDFMKEGYLWKKGPRTNDAYRKRYVVLDSRKLMYLDSRHDAFPLGEIYLGENSEGYTVSKGGDTNSKTYPHGLVLMTPERTWHFGSETEEDRDSWIEALNRVIQNLPQEYSVNLRHNLRNSYAFKKNRGSSGSGGRSSTSSGSGPHNIGHKSLLDALTPSRWSNKSS